MYKRPLIWPRCIGSIFMIAAAKATLTIGVVETVVRQNLIQGRCD
jgi:hypothetical protein